jgi:hypothetical protein
MKTFLTIVSIFALVLVMPAIAAKKGNGPGATPTPAYKVVQVDAVSITVTVGESGTEHFTYKISDSTKVTLNGAPIAARDLRAGMVARLSVSPDRTSVLAIDAKDAPAAKPTHPGRRRLG